jgi:hypothetical protein
LRRRDLQPEPWHPQHLERYCEKQQNRIHHFVGSLSIQQQILAIENNPSFRSIQKALRRNVSLLNNNAWSNHAIKPLPARFALPVESLDEKANIKYARLKTAVPIRVWSSRLRVTYVISSSTWMKCTTRVTDVADRHLLGCSLLGFTDSWIGPSWMQYHRRNDVLHPRDTPLFLSPSSKKALS